MKLWVAIWVGFYRLRQRHIIEQVRCKLAIAQPTHRGQAAAVAFCQQTAHFVEKSLRHHVQHALVGALVQSLALHRQPVDPDVDSRSDACPAVR